MFDRFLNIGFRTSLNLVVFVKEEPVMQNKRLLPATNVIPGPKYNNSEITITNNITKAS